MGKWGRSFTLTSKMYRMACKHPSKMCVPLCVNKLNVSKARWGRLIVGSKASNTALQKYYNSSENYLL